MPRKKRDYRAEYARRLAIGRQRGQTVKQARGHGGDLTKSQRQAGAVVVTRGLGTSQIKARLGQLRGDRRARVIVEYENGTQAVVAGKRGPSKASDIRDWIAEYENVEDFIEQNGGYAGDVGKIVSINIVWS